MDWRTDSFGSPAVPSFLYAVNLPGDRVLLEETDLVGAPALSITELRERLHQRLGWASGTRGRAGDLDDVESSRGVFATEKVRFPVLPAKRPKGLETFGTAGTAGHPATGYSVGEILRSAVGAADALAAGRLEVARRVRTDNDFRAKWADHQKLIDDAATARLVTQKESGRVRTDVSDKVMFTYLDMVLDGLISHLASGGDVEIAEEVLDLVEQSVRTSD